MITNVDKFQNNLKINFKKKSLLIEALTHKSANQKNNNERMVLHTNFYIFTNIYNTVSG